MALPGKKIQEKLQGMKDDVEQADSWFRENNDRWHGEKERIFFRSLDDDDVSALKATEKPTLEFSLEEAYVSRQRGEFNKNTPSIEVRADYGVPVEPEVIDSVEGTVRHIFMKSKQDDTEARLHTDMLGGGFGVGEISTEYANSRSFHQTIKFSRVNNPTLCGFDPLAKLPHKGDGRFCYKLYPMRKDEIKSKWSVDMENISSLASGEQEEFNWVYKSGNKDVVVVSDYYTKKQKKTEIIELANRKVMKADEYDDFIAKWKDSKTILQPPEIINRREVDDETVCRYIFINGVVLEYEETDFSMFGLVFFDGNSVEFKDSSGKMKQHTRSYCHNTRGIQKLANFAGNCFANELENMVQHKLMIAEETISPDFSDALVNVQCPNTVVYRSLWKNDPRVKLDRPELINRAPLDGSIFQSFMAAPQMMQAIYGSYDASLGINDNQLSGSAIREGAIQSNAASMQCRMGYVQGLNRVANIIVDLIPKYYITPRTIPIVNRNMKKEYIPINQENGVDLTYDSNALHVVVESGVDFAAQKNNSLKTLIELSQAIPSVGDFVNSECLPEILDNLEIRHIDKIKRDAELWLKKQAAIKQQQQQMQQQQMQMQMQMQQQQMQMQQQSGQNNPQMIRVMNEQAKIKIEAEQNDHDNILKATQLSIANEEVQNERIKILSEIKNSERDAVVQMDKHETEKTRAAVDMSIKAAQMHQKHGIDIHDMALKHAKHALDANGMNLKLDKINS